MRDDKIARRAAPNQNILALPLLKGENTVLLKIDQRVAVGDFIFGIG